MLSTSVKCGREIDIREEMYNILVTEKRGHYVVYRRFDRKHFSKYYNPETREGVGGPKFSWTDELHLCRREENPTDLSGATPGDLQTPYGRLFFMYDLYPKMEDEIFEVVLDDNGKVSYPLNLIKRFSINQIIPWRDRFQGRIEYYELLIKPEVTKW